MAGQNQLFKLIPLFGSYKNLFNNRPLVIACQQSFGLKQSTKDKIKQLNLPEKPKRPPSPYIRYCGEQLSVLKKKDPNIKLTEIVKKISANWKEIQPEVKQQYEQDFKKEMVEYQKRYSDYDNKLTDEQKEFLTSVAKEKSKIKKKRHQKQLEKETNKPKKPRTPYLLFVTEYLKTNNTKLKEALPTITEKWRHLSEGEKQKYQDEYVVAKKVYENEMKIWEAEMVNQESQSTSKLQSSNVQNLSKKSNKKVGSKITKAQVEETSKLDSDGSIGNDKESRSEHHLKESMEQPETKDNKRGNKKGFLKRLFKF